MHCHFYQTAGGRETHSVLARDWRHRIESDQEALIVVHHSCVHVTRNLLHMRIVESDTGYTHRDGPAQSFSASCSAQLATSRGTYITTGFHAAAGCPVALLCACRLTGPSFRLRSSWRENIGCLTLRRKKIRNSGRVDLVPVTQRTFHHNPMTIWQRLPLSQSTVSGQTPRMRRGCQNITRVRHGSLAQHHSFFTTHSDCVFCPNGIVVVQGMNQTAKQFFLQPGTYPP